MTRRTLLVLVAILVSVFAIGPISPVGACELDARDQCVAMAAPTATVLYATAIIPVPVVSNDTLVTVPSDMP